MAHIPTPRLLPLTIFAMGGLLAMKICGQIIA